MVEQITVLSKQEKIILAEDCRNALIKFIQKLQEAKDKIHESIYKSYDEGIIQPFKMVHRGVVEINDEKIMDEFIKIYQIALLVYTHRADTLKSIGVELAFVAIPQAKFIPLR